MTAVGIILVGMAVFTAAKPETRAISFTHPIVQTEEFRCDYTRAVQCSASGCQDKKVESYLLMPTVDALFRASIRAADDDNLPSIRSCNRWGCVAIPVRATLVGAFMSLISPQGTYVLRVQVTDLEFMKTKRGGFVEVSTMFLETWTSFGFCSAIVK